MAKSPVEWNPDPEMARAYGLVGEFMSRWAILESSLNDGVHKLCGLSGIEAFAITANMGVRDKIHTARTMLNLRTADPDRLKIIGKLLDRIGTMSGHRNTVAHTQFIAHENGVKFFVIKAKGKFEVPDIVWTVGDFSSRGHEMLVLSDQLDREVHKCAVTKLRRNLNAFALAPTPSTNALAEPFPQAPPIPGLLGYLLPTPTEDGETPQEPQEAAPEA